MITRFSPRPDEPLSPVKLAAGPIDLEAAHPMKQDPVNAFLANPILYPFYLTFSADANFFSYQARGL